MSIRDSIDQVRRKQEDIADDRVRRDGRLGDEELHSFLVVPYPTLTGQVN
jgi:hypothetical protein